jgi:hypothetical protein
MFEAKFAGSNPVKITFCSNDGKIIGEKSTENEIKNNDKN